MSKEIRTEGITSDGTIETLYVGNKPIAILFKRSKWVGQLLDTKTVVLARDQKQDLIAELVAEHQKRWKQQVENMKGETKMNPINFFAARDKKSNKITPHTIVADLQDRVDDVEDLVVVVVTTTGRIQTAWSTYAHEAVGLLQIASTDVIESMKK
jgi:hypothetical protein